MSLFIHEDEVHRLMLLGIYTLTLLQEGLSHVWLRLYWFAHKPRQFYSRAITGPAFLLSAAY